MYYFCLYFGFWVRGWIVVFMEMVGKGNVIYIISVIINFELGILL